MQAEDLVEVAVLRILERPLSIGVSGLACPENDLDAWSDQLKWTIVAGPHIDGIQSSVTAVDKGDRSPPNCPKDLQIAMLFCVVVGNSPNSQLAIAVCASVG